MFQVFPSQERSIRSNPSLNLSTKGNYHQKGSERVFYLNIFFFCYNKKIRKESPWYFLIILFLVHAKSKHKRKIQIWKSSFPYTQSCFLGGKVPLFCHWSLTSSGNSCSSEVMTFWFHLEIALDTSLALLVWKEYFLLFVFETKRCN